MTQPKLYVVMCQTADLGGGWRQSSYTVRAYTAQDAAYQASLLIDSVKGESVISVEPAEVKP